MRRCRHHWTEAGRHYTPPPVGAKASSAPPDLVRDLAFGLTVVEQKCDQCGLIQFVRSTGDARPEQ